MTLKDRLQSKPILLAPGVADALTAHLAQRAGAEAIYLSGASIAYTRLGRPDIGLVSMSEVVETIHLVRDRVATPLIVDADNGYGNALNVQRTVRLFERAGASAIQLEDQSYPKRCGHLQEKHLISAQEMVGKIKAACDARADRWTLIIARTDAVAVEGLEPAIQRAALYRDAGADMLFVEAPGSTTELWDIPRRLGDGIPLMANMVEGGVTPVTNTKVLQEMGYALAIFPGGVVRAMAHAAAAFYATLMADGSSDAFRDQMFDFQGLNAVIGTPAMLALSQRYKGGA
jgi:2-methylisocitrate lyase-like PEP mutase family enzyme